MADEFVDRKKLTFEQAEGVEPLPTQLRLKEISQVLRAALWHHVYSLLDKSAKLTAMGTPIIHDPWASILKDEHVYRSGRMVDDYSTAARKIIPEVRRIFEDGNYTEIFGWLEFVLKHPRCPNDFAPHVEDILRFCRAAYRVVDNVIICPLASEAEHLAVVRAFNDLSSADFTGARAHLRNAATRLTNGLYADSIRESIHSVESVCRTLDASADLSKALAKLETKIQLHAAMRKGFSALYGYTSDQNGIRHALLETGQANVDETDALFMLGACASFVSYLINKARLADLI